MKPEPQKRICGECIHEYACSAWNRGNMHNTDARNCANYETVKTSNAYYIGVQDGMKIAKAETATDDNELKSCPYCGGKVEIFENYLKQFGVHCTVCGMITFFGNDSQNKQKVTCRWNERAGT